MRTRHATTACAAVVVCGGWASPAANAEPASPRQAQAVQTAQLGYPYYHRGYPFYRPHQWWRYRYWRHGRWHYYS
jgi:hypothetical protein